MVNISIDLLKVLIFYFRVFKGHKHSANYVIIFQNDIFLSVSDDSSIKLWNINKEEEETTL